MSRKQNGDGRLAMKGAYTRLSIFRRAIAFFQRRETALMLFIRISGNLPRLERNGFLSCTAQGA